MLLREPVCKGTMHDLTEGYSLMIHLSFGKLDELDGFVHG